MFFTIFSRGRAFPQGIRSKAFLVEDFWDDWGKYRTMFNLVVFDHDGKRFEPGYVKIGQRGLLPSQSPKPGSRTPEFSNEFESLDDRYFSLGQDETYYETLNSLPDDLRRKVLEGLKDCTYDLEVFESAENEVVMQESLLRSVSSENVKNRLHRLALGDAKLTEFLFEYVFPEIGDPRQPPPVLSFHVEPESEPPTNVHVLIGRNGVGKTRCLQNMARALLDIDSQGHPSGILRPCGDNQGDWSFAGLLSVSFSAFDDFDMSEVSQRTAIRFNRVDLRQRDDSSDVRVTTVKTPQQLAKDFSSSFERCRQGLKAERWLSAVRTLESDPLFREKDVTTLLDAPDSNWQIGAEDLFSSLSAGHSVVLLTITRLVELVDERTLVLIDEPESHLHPPLLSAFIRSLADLLISRNGVAVIATHSPVVLQEVPKSCVWMLRRSGNLSIAEKPSIETFGENVGILTREVFGLEVTSAGFHEMLRQAVEVERLDYNRLLHHFKGQLGAEARAIARGLIAERDEGGGR